MLHHSAPALAGFVVEDGAPAPALRGPALRHVRQVLQRQGLPHRPLQHSTLQPVSLRMRQWSWDSAKHFRVRVCRKAIDCYDMPCLKASRQTREPHLLILQRSEEPGGGIRIARARKAQVLGRDDVDCYAPCIQASRLAPQSHTMASSACSVTETIQQAAAEWSHAARHKYS